MFVARAGRGAESCPGREQFVEDRENDGHEKDPDGPMCQGVNDRAASLSHLVRDHSGEFAGSVRATAFARGAEPGIAGPFLIGDELVRLRPDELETELLPRGREAALVTRQWHLAETRIWNGYPRRAAGSKVGEAPVADGACGSGPHRDRAGAIPRAPRRPTVYHAPTLTRVHFDQHANLLRMLLISD